MEVEEVRAREVEAGRGESERGGDRERKRVETRER